MEGEYQEKTIQPVFRMRYLGKASKWSIFCLKVRVLFKYKIRECLHLWVKDSPPTEYKIIVKGKVVGTYIGEQSYGFFAKPFFAKHPELKGIVKHFDHINLVIWDVKPPSSFVTEDGTLILT